MLYLSRNIPKIFKIFSFVLMIHIILFTSIDFYSFAQDNDISSSYINKYKDELSNKLSHKHGYVPKSYVLYDIDNDDVIISYNKEDVIGLASVTKLMTAYLLLDKIKEGKITYSDKVTISNNAASKEGYRAKLHENMIVSVDDLLHALLICSSNDAAVAIAEYIAGSEDDFADLMNDKLDTLNLQGHFQNASGLTNYSFKKCKKITLPEQNVMNAIGIAKLADHLISEYPEIIKITSQAQYKLKSNNAYIRNTNKLLGVRQGVFGMKTGYTNFAGYCQVTGQYVYPHYKYSEVCKKSTNYHTLRHTLFDKHRIISVLLGSHSFHDRKVISSELLDYINNFDINVLSIKGMKFNPSLLEITDVPKDMYIFADKTSLKWFPKGFNFQYKFMYNANWLAKKKLPKQDLTANRPTEGNCIGKIVFYSGEEIFDEVPVLLAYK